MTAELSRKANQCARGAETAVRPSIPPLRHATAGQRIPTVRSFLQRVCGTQGRGGGDEEVETWCSKKTVPRLSLVSADLSFYSSVGAPSSWADRHTSGARRHMSICLLRRQGGKGRTTNILISTFHAGVARRLA